MASVPAMPALPTPVKMPVPGDQAQLAAQRQAQQALIGQSGRESTNLDRSAHGGGGNYTGTWLGK